MSSHHKSSKLQVSHYMNVVFKLIIITILSLNKLQVLAHQEIERTIRATNASQTSTNYSDYFPPLRVATDRINRNMQCQPRDNSTIRIGYITNLVFFTKPKGQGYTNSGVVTYALEKLNRYPHRYNGRRIELMFNDTRGDHPHGVASVLHQWQQGAAVIFGPEDQCANEAALASSINMPMISHKCGDDKVSDKNVYKTFIRTSPSDVEMVKSVIKLLKYHKWYKFSIISEVTSHYQNVERTLTNMSRTHDLTINMATNFRNVYECCLKNLECCYGQFYDLVSKTYEKTRIYVFIGPKYDLVDFMHVLHLFGLMSNGDYAIIYADVDTDQYDAELSYQYLYDFEKSKKDNVTQLILLECARSLLVVVASPPAKDMSKFHDEVRKYNSMPPFDSLPRLADQNMTVTAYAVYLYDAIFLWAEAIAKILKKGGDIYDGEQVVKLIIDRKSYRSISGPMINIDKNGDVEANHTVLGLIPVPSHLKLWYGKSFSLQRYNETMYPIAHFESNTSGGPEVIFNHQWPNWTKVAEDEPECGYDGLKCHYDSSEVTKYKINMILLALNVLLHGSWIAFFVVGNTKLKITHVLWTIDRREWYWEKPSEQVSGLVDLDKEFMLALSSKYRYTRTAIRGLTRVAIKELRFSRNQRCSIDKSMKSELVFMRDIKSENVLAFMGATLSSSKTRFYMLNDYGEKGSLYDLLKRPFSAFDQMFILSLLFDLMHGLTYLHDSPVKCHGNLRSTNCIIGARWVLKLSDFGIHPIRRRAKNNVYNKMDETFYLDAGMPEPVLPLVKEPTLGQRFIALFDPIRALPVFRTIFGKRDKTDEEDEDNEVPPKKQKNYMRLLWSAPELLRYPFQEPDVKSDIYSFAIIVHEMFFREGPFGVDTIGMKPNEIIKRVQIPPKGVPLEPDVEKLEIPRGVKQERQMRREPPPIRQIDVLGWARDKFNIRSGWVRPSSNNSSEETMRFDKAEEIELAEVHTPQQQPQDQSPDAEQSLTQEQPREQEPNGYQDQVMHAEVHHSAPIDVEVDQPPQEHQDPKIEQLETVVKQDPIIEQQEPEVEKHIQEDQLQEHQDPKMEEEAEVLQHRGVANPQEEQEVERLQEHQESKIEKKQHVKPQAEVDRPRNQLEPKLEKSQSQPQRTIHLPGSSSSSTSAMISPMHFPQSNDDEEADVLRKSTEPMLPEQSLKPDSRDDTIKPDPIKPTKPPFFKGFLIRKFGSSTRESPKPELARSPNRSLSTDQTRRRKQKQIVQKPVTPASPIQKLTISDAEDVPVKFQKSVKSPQSDQSPRTTITPHSVMSILNPVSCPPSVSPQSQQQQQPHLGHQQAGDNPDKQQQAIPLIPQLFWPNDWTIRENEPYRPSLFFRPNAEKDVDGGKGFIKRVLRRCWAENPRGRPHFRNIRQCLISMKAGAGRYSVMDNMIALLDLYMKNMQDIVNMKLTHVEEERAKSVSLLHSMLPPYVASQLVSGTSVVPLIFKRCTIYFSDVVGFTALSASSSPMQVCQFLNELYTAFDDKTKMYNLYKVETIGDAYMVCGGVPRYNKRHTADIAALSLDLLEVSVKFKIRHKPDELNIRIGLHTGPVVAGVVGHLMPRYCLFGDTVNMASRMESSSMQRQIHMSKYTAKYLIREGSFQVKDRGQIEIKGKGPAFTYWLLGRRKKPERFVEGKMIGDEPLTEEESAFYEIYDKEMTLCKSVITDKESSESETEEDRDLYRRIGGFDLNPPPVLFKM